MSADPAGKPVPAPPDVRRTALLLLPLQLLFRGGEAVLPLLLAAWFGRSPETDLFYLLSAGTTLAGALLLAAFQDSALIPVLLEVEARGRAAYEELVAALAGYTLLGASLLAGGLAALGGLWFGLIRAGPLRPLALQLVLLFALYLVALALRSLLTGILNARRLYAAHPVASGLGMACTLAVLAALRGALSVRAIPLALLCGELLAALLLLGFLRRRSGLPLRLSLARPEPLLRLSRLLGFEVVGSTLTRANPLLDQMVAGLSPIPGGGTLLRYATDVASLPTSILQATLFPVLLSRLSHDAIHGAPGQLLRTVKRTLAAVCGLLFAVSALVYLAREPLLRLLFLRGAMDAAGVARMAEVLPWALAGVVPFGALLVLARAHVALQNSRIMVGMGALNAVLNAGFDVAFFAWMGLSGIALATAAMHAAVALVFWFLLLRRLRQGAPEVPPPVPPATSR